MSNHASALNKGKIQAIFPQLFERYELSGKKPIGAVSGFGTVWRAHDQWLERDVAIKISDKDLSEELLLCRDIEGQTVRIFEYLRGDNGWNAYVMELLDAPWISVSQFITKHKYKNNDTQHYFDCFEIARSILNGLTQIHGRPYSRQGRFVHADIKPDNLFVMLRPKKRPHTVFRMPAEGEMVKIIDMGISILRGKELIGRTHSYSHPEMNLARQGVDLYSIAITFLELLTGTCPDHSTMQNKTRIRSFLQNYSSGSSFLDGLVVELVSNCARSVSLSGNRSHKILAQLEEALFTVEPTYLLSIRAINKEVGVGCKKDELADVLFKNTFSSQYGWSNMTKNRLVVIKDFIKEMYDRNMLIRNGHNYFIR